MMRSDWKTNDPGYGVSADVSYSLGGNWGVLSRLGFDDLYGKNSANQNVLSTVCAGNLALSYDFLRNNLLDPYVFAGAGVAYYSPRIVSGPFLVSGRSRQWDVSLNGGLGFDFYLDESWSIMVTAEAGYMGSDAVDGYGGGSNDLIGRISFGVRYFLFDRSTVERIVNAVSRRSAME
jgi:hypothetical protein